MSDFLEMADSAWNLVCSTTEVEDIARLHVNVRHSVCIEIVNVISTIIFLNPALTLSCFLFLHLQSITSLSFLLLLLSYLK